MPKTVLNSFVTGTRALLVAQLIACIGAIALAGWTLGVTGQVLRERNRLQERVIQLEEAMAASGVIPPPLSTVVIHVRSDIDLAAAESIARALQADHVRALINVMTASDQRPSGYAYFDGRQSRAAADIVARFHDLAREQQVAQWSAQLRGTALPARGEYTADRLDIVLPPLPPPPPPPVEAPVAAVTTTPQP